MASSGRRLIDWQFYQTLLNIENKARLRSTKEEATVTQKVIQKTFAGAVREQQDTNFLDFVRPARAIVGQATASNRLPLSSSTNPTRVQPQKQPPSPENGDIGQLKTSFAGIFHSHCRSSMPPHTVGPPPSISLVGDLQIWAIIPNISHRKRHRWSHQRCRCTVAVNGSVGPVCYDHVCKFVRVCDLRSYPANWSPKTQTCDRVHDPDWRWHTMHHPQICVHREKSKATSSPGPVQQFYILNQPEWLGLFQYHSRK